MKKIYNQPTMVVTEVKLQQMIAASPLGKSDDEITDPNAILSRRRRRNNDWEDDWEDEEDY